MAEAKSITIREKPAESSTEKPPKQENNALRLHVGDTLQIELLTETGQQHGQRYLVKVIGYYPGRSIINPSCHLSGDEDRIRNMIFQAAN